MKRAALLLAPLGLALGAPALSLAAQDADAILPENQDGTNGEFVWPSFIEAEPLPGRYRMTMTLENMRMPGLDGGKETAGVAAAMGEPDVEYICLDADVPRMDLLEEFRGESCTINGPTGNDEAFALRAQCVSGDGNEIEMRMTGSASDQGFDMLMAMTTRFAESGKLAMDMRIRIERIGDCE